MCIDVPVRVGGWLVCVDLVLLCGVPENLYLGVVPRFRGKNRMLCVVCIFVGVCSFCMCVVRADVLAVYGA